MERLRLKGQGNIGRYPLISPGSLETARETRERERERERETGEVERERKREREISLITRVLHISAIFFYFT